MTAGPNQAGQGAEEVQGAGQGGGRGRDTTGMDPDPDLDPSNIKQKSRKTLISPVL